MIGVGRRRIGAGLLKTPLDAVKLAQAVVRAVSIPVTAKLRSGWDEEDSALTLVPALEEAGIAAITIHGRTCLQKYSGQADWEIVQKIVAKVHRIPIIGNGDITSPARAQAMFAETGCAGIMIGRAALKNPWGIRDMNSALQGFPIVQPTRQERIDLMKQHFEAMVRQHGDTIGTLLFHRWIPPYSRSLNLGREIMISLLQIRQADVLRRQFNTLA